MENKELLPKDIKENKLVNNESSSYEEASEKLKNKKKIGWFGKMYGLRDEEDEDLNFIYSNYSNANERPNRISNMVFLFIVIFFTGAFTWAALAEVDELARGNGKVIPSDKIQRIQSLDEELFQKY